MSLLLLLSLTVGAAPHPTIPGWTAGTPAEGTAEAIAPISPVVLSLPAEIAKKITGPTALFYFSPTCPHCWAVMPEVNALASEGALAWLGVAVGSSKPADLATFKADHSPRFDIVIDTGRSFSQAVAARSTPSVYVARPAPEGAAPEPGLPITEGGIPVEITQAFTPFARGQGALLKLRSHPDTPFADFSGYQGDRVCGTCHTQELRSWALTHHALAYHTLYDRDRAQDLKCVGCHVTGMDAPGGFQVGDHGSPLAGVTCEACHGPSGPHDGVNDAALGTCVGCHDAEHSVRFTTDKGLPHIDHFAAQELSDAEMQSRFSALLTGEAERPLLAFEDGETVGAKACQSCHRAEHRWWRKTQHHTAMGRLAPGEDEGPNCIRCHSTPQRYGTALGKAKTVADFRVDEGVGCESCHGGGAAHVAAPTKENIVGLGDSCPECVIEAICRQCHTPAWDPGWELKPALEAIAHE